MTLQHKHLIVRAEISRCPNEEDLNKVTDWVRKLIKQIGMKLLGGPYGTYCNEAGNRGMTIVSIIETSHIAFHIWDEVSPGLLQFDVYSCADFDPHVIFKAIDDFFGAVKIEYKFLDRENGLQEIAIP